MRTPYGGFTTTRPVRRASSPAGSTRSRRSNTQVIAEAGTIGIGDRGADRASGRDRCRHSARPRARRACAAASAVGAQFAATAPHRAAASARSRTGVAAVRARRWRRSSPPRSRACPSRTSGRRTPPPSAAIAGQPDAQQQCGREVLLERRLDAGLAVAAPMQRLAAQVDADGDALAREAQAHAQVGRGQVDGRPLARAARASGRRSRPWRAAPRTACGAASAATRRRRRPRTCRPAARASPTAARAGRGTSRRDRWRRGRRASAARGSRCATAGRRGTRCAAAREKLDARRMFALDLDAELAQLARQHVR